MGRSTTSCFKIISCGGSNESVDRDEIDVSPENKGADKRGWSFRKRSARHRVLSNTVVTEAPSSENKQSSEPITISSEPQINSNISDKTPDSIWTEEPPRFSHSSTKNTTVSVSTVATESACEEDEVKREPVPDESESESAVLVIQTAVRRFLAQRQLVKHKNVVKLQAAVRGHLVRSHAVGTLRCVQAIVKMQALVRARQDKGVQNAGISSNPTYISVEKLLNNRLARQLLESTPRTKQINVKCDPSKSDSAWNWLERWMSASSPETLESHVPEQEDKVKITENEIKTLTLSNVGEAKAAVPFEASSPETLESLVPEQEDKVKITENEIKTLTLSNVGEAKAAVPFEEKEILIEIEEKSFEINHEDEKLQPADTSIPDSIEKPESPPDEPMKLITEAQIEVNSIPENPISETVPKRSGKRLATDQPDSEGRKSVFGSRKASNPAFIAAQSRFEELTSKTNPLKPAQSSNQDDQAGSASPADIISSDPLKPVNSSNQDDVAGSGSPADIGSSDPLKPDNELHSSADFDSSAHEKATPVTDVEPDEYLISHGSRLVQNGGSECGTELSITSTLDSPDQFEVENKKFEEAKVSNETVSVKPEIHNTGEDANVAVSQIDQKLDDIDIELEPESGHHVYKSNEHEIIPQMSAEGSPRSHITVPESQGTPSSQISTNTKKTKSDKKVSSQKRKSWSTSKKSPSVTSSIDSGLRSSLEQLPKDPKPGKRRNSFGSPKPDHNDHEPSVPSYMQATESARAKAIANSSPRSSPDVQDKETYLKKRHSLPGAVNGRQGSPRIQRSMSQALQTTKGNGNQERKWQR